MIDVQIIRDRPGTKAGTVTIVVGSERRTLTIAEWSKLLLAEKPPAPVALA